MQKGIAAAKDLARQEPRDFSEELQGYPQLPRTLDKARASLAGTSGKYNFGCPVDHTLMARLGVEPQVVLDLAAEHADDDAVLEGLREHGIPSPEEAWFDAQAVEDQVGDGPFLKVRSADVSVIDAAPGEEEEPHEHEHEELVVVTGGAARYFLGRSERIVRAGEVLRIPAGVTHRYAVSGEDAFRAVSAVAS